MKALTPGMGKTENVDPFLMACETYKEAREKLLESVADIWF